MQTLLAEARAHPRYAALESYYDSFGFVAGTPSGAIVRRDGAIVTRVLVIPYQPPEAQDTAYLAFGKSADGSAIAIGLRFESANEIALGFRKRENGPIAVEVIDLRALAATAPQRAVAPRRAVAAGGSVNNPVCEACLESCQASIQMQKAACALVVLTAAIDAGFSARSALKAASSAVGTAQEFLDTFAEVGSAWSSASDIQNCSNPQNLDCSASGAMCRDACVGCSTNAECGGGTSACAGGTCRLICQGKLCGPLETCSPTGCIPAQATPACVGTFMGFYRAGRSVAPFCCSFGGGDCGALPNGFWGGCCPTPSSTCISVGIGHPAFGCCLIGGPDDRC